MGVVAKITQNDLPRLKKKLDNLANTKELFRKIGSYMTSSTQRKINEGKFEANKPLTVKLKGSSKVLRDKGHLLASLASKAEDDAVIIGTNYPPAWMLHEGGEIKAKNAKKLAIPATREMKKLVLRYGSVRKTLEALKKQGWKIWFAESAILGTNKKLTKGKSAVLFIRKESVDIPERKFLYVDDIDERVIEEMMINHAKKA